MRFSKRFGNNVDNCVTCRILCYKVATTTTGIEYLKCERETSKVEEI